MGLTRAAIQRPVFVLVLMLAALLLGAIGFRSMRLEENPDVAFGVITITTVYPGAGPEEVNNLVSRRLEDAVSAVAGIRTVNSTSQEGVSVVALQFEFGTDINEALNDVRSKVDTVVRDLPTEAERPIVSKFDTTAEPILTLVLSSATLSNRALRGLADNEIRDRLSRVPGVASVAVTGGDIREIQIQLRKNALIAAGVGVLDVQQAIQRATLNVPSGRIVDGGEETTVRVVGEFPSVAAMNDMFLSVSDPRNPQAPPRALRLGDVARVVDANAERRQFSRLDGRDTVVISVQKSREGNAVQISQALRDGVGADPPLLTELSRQYGVDFTVSLDTSTRIKESLFDLGFAIMFGIVLVTSVIWIFLHNFRGTLIVAIAIPICFFGTFIVLWLLGFTINSMSMLALSLAIGALVDDSIVVIENTYRHLTMGEEPMEAAINGRSEIGLAAIAITMADVVVFIPIAFMGGIVGQFFKPLGIGFAACLLISLFVSFTVTPMLAARWYRKGEDWERPKGRFAQWFERGWNRFGDRYAKVLRWSLIHHWPVFIGGFVVLFALFMFIAGSFVPPQEGYVAALRMALPLMLVAVALGGLTFLVRLFQRRFQPMLLVYAALFGLMFPIGAMAGHAYRVWKAEDVFKIAFVPPTDSGAVRVNIELPPGASLQATTDVVVRVERVLGEHPDVKNVLSTVGQQGAGFAQQNQGANLAQVSATLYDRAALLDTIAFWVEHKERLRSRADSAVAADVLQAIGRVPGARVTVSTGDAFGFGAAIQMGFRSEDREALLATAERIRDGLAAGAVPGVVSPTISSKPGKPELRAIPDRARQGTSGVSTAEIGSVMRILYEGDTQAKYRSRGREYDIRVMMDLGDRNNPTTVDQIPVRFHNGQPVFLTEVARLVTGEGVDKIERADRQEQIQVTADLLPGFAAGTVQSQIDQWMQGQNLIAEQVQYSPLGQADAQARESGYLFAALGLGLILVYMVLASLYENLLYPLIIQLAQPQALVGALLALMLTDNTLNIVGMIGIIALVGLVGKNAILLVDYTNTLRDRGKDRFQALVEAGRTRLRPIMMTTIALIVGMLPVALAIGRGSEFRETIGITIIGGVIVSTVLTLLVIPCSYWILDDASMALGRLIRRFNKHLRPPGPPGPSKGADGVAHDGLAAKELEAKEPT